MQVERLSAGVDYPISLFWKDLIKMYPNAKVHIICCFKMSFASMNSYQVGSLINCTQVTGLSKISLASWNSLPNMYHRAQWSHPQDTQPYIEWKQVLLNDRDPVRWYESVKNTIFNVVALFNSPIVAFNPLLQLILVLTGRTAMTIVPKVPSLWNEMWMQRNTSLFRIQSFQAVCYAPTPLGSAFPRGMFGAVEDGQEEAVRFFEAWKAEVGFQLLSAKSGKYFSGDKGGACRQAACVAGETRLGTPLSGERPSSKI